jgi:hypothetical protein
VIVFSMTVSLYPDYLRGGDTGDEPLVDVEAVRIRPEGIAGGEADTYGCVEPI